MDPVTHAAMMAPVRALAMQAQREEWHDTAGALFVVWDTLMSPDAMTLTIGYLSDAIGAALVEMARLTQDIEPDACNMRAEEYLEYLQYVLNIMSQYPDDGVIPHPPTYPFHKG
jgi:hypothetical protein